MVAPEGDKVRGRPLSLVDVLRSASDRTSQLRATESYWRLAETLADYNFTWDEYQQIERLKPATSPQEQPSPEQHMLSTRLAAAKARLQDAELALVAAQYDLAGAIRLPAGQALPLPIDPPHVGPYRTLLEQVYTGRTIPARAVLIDRTLPIRRGAIDARAVAVQAAADALEAVEESHFEGRSDLALVLTLIDDLASQRRAFLADVRVYNYEIAEYAMSAPTPTLDAQGLASMLIKPSASARPSAIAGGTGASPGMAGGVERAGFNQQIGMPPASPLQPVPEGQIQLAPPPGYPAAPARNEPTLAPPQPTQPPRQEQDPKPPRIGVTKAGGTMQPPINIGDAKAHEAARPLGSEQATTAAADVAPAASTPTYLYPALRQMTAEDQARQLALVLCWEPAEASANVTPISLENFLAVVPVERRRDALTAYWHSQFYTACAQALAQQLEQFEALGATIAVGHIGGARGAGPAMLLVRAAQLAAEADSRRAQADRLGAEWSLTMSAGRPLTAKWLVAETPPHAGGYRMQLADLPRDVRDSPNVQRLAAVIPQLRRTVAERAAAVVAADQARGSTVLDSGDALTETRQALKAIQAQTTETTAFLARLADYNVEIANFASIVLPPATTNGSLVRALVTADEIASSRANADR
jgi:hypothetical protein